MLVCVLMLSTGALFNTGLWRRMEKNDNEVVVTVSLMVI